MVPFLTDEPASVELLPPQLTTVAIKMIASANISNRFAILSTSLYWLLNLSCYSQLSRT